MEIVSQSRAFFKKAPVLVLDSSFNPPHRAHYALVRLAAAHHQSTTATSTAEPVRVNVVLSYSATNADKGTASAREQARRADMIRLFGEWFFPAKAAAAATTTTAAPVEWAVAVVRTASPRFVDKCRDLAALLRARADPAEHELAQRLVFLMGFDTLVRLLDPKYYYDDAGESQIMAALGPFFEDARVWALPRGEADPARSKAAWLGSSSDGARAFPTAWAARVDILDPRAAPLQPEDGGPAAHHRIPLDKVSSTTARAAARAGDWDTVLDIVACPHVLDYIRENELYRD